MFATPVVKITHSLYLPPGKTKGIRLSGHREKRKASRSEAPPGKTKGIRLYLYAPPGKMKVIRLCATGKNEGHPALRHREK
jgi:hypothetical protein